MTTIYEPELSVAHGQTYTVTAGETVDVSGSVTNEGVLNVNGVLECADLQNNKPGEGPGFLDGVVTVADDGVIVLEGGGQIKAIEEGAVTIDGPDAFIADASDTSANSALQGLNWIDGALNLDDTAVSVTSDLYVGGSLNVDGGSDLSIGGQLTNLRTVAIGSSGLAVATTVSAAALGNSGTLTIEGGSASATLSVTSYVTNTGTIDVETGGVLKIAKWHGAGEIELTGDGLIEILGGGQITTVLSGSTLTIDGPNAFVADASDTSANSALQSLRWINGVLNLDDSDISTTVDMNVTGSLNVGGGSDLSIAGQLTNSSTVAIGSSALAVATTVSAAALGNSGTITIEGGSASATLSVTGDVNNTGTINVESGGVLKVDGWYGEGKVTLSGDGLIELPGADQLTTIVSGSTLTIDGQDAVIADASDTSADSALQGLKWIDGTLNLVGTSPSLVTATGMNVTGSLNVNGGSPSIGGQLTNQHTVTISSGNSGAALSAKALGNTGTITIDGVNGAGTILLIRGEINNDGTIEVEGTNALLEVTGWSTGEGKIELTGGAEAELNGAGSGAIDFLGVGEVVVTGAENSLGNVLSDFAQDDSVEFANIDYSTALKLGYAADPGSTGGTVMIENSSGATVGKFQVTGSYALDDFVLGYNLFNQVVVSFFTPITTVEDLTVDGGSSIYEQTLEKELATLATVEGRLNLESGADVSTLGPVTNAGEVALDDGDTVGGTIFDVGGAITNGSYFLVGNIGQSPIQSDDLVEASSFVNELRATLELEGGPKGLAELEIKGAAQLGATAGVLDGYVTLEDDSLIEFLGGGQITTITSTSTLTIDGPDAFIADASDTSSSSALQGLASIETGATLVLNDAVLVTDGGLNLAGNFEIDFSGGGGGSDVSIGGELTVTTPAQNEEDEPWGLLIGSSGMTRATSVTVGGLNNESAVEIGGAGAQTILNVNGDLINDDTITVGGSSVLKVTGSSTGGGQIEIGGQGSELYLDGAGSSDDIDLTGDYVQIFVTGSSQILNNPISNWNIGTVIDFASTVYSSLDTVSLSPIVSSGTTTGEYVNIDNSSGATIAQFVVNGVYPLSDFQLGHDSNNHVTVTYTLGGAA